GCGTLDGRVDLSGRPISDFSQSLLRSLEVRGRNQEIEVRKASQAEIVVKRLRQHRPFIWDRPQLPPLEVLHDACQFSGEPQAAPQIRFVRGSQRSLDFR